MTLLETFVMMLGTSIGVNMLKADPRLWVSVSKHYDGFAFKPNKGWLSYAVAKNTTDHSGRNQRTSGTAKSLQTTTTDVCTRSKLWGNKVVGKNRA